jgi:putative ABC transport system permease protein
MMRPSGGLRSALIVGLQGIRARKLRTLLSMISLFLGVLAVVIVQASAETANRAATADIELSAGKDGTRQAYLPSDARTLPIIMDTSKDRPGVVLQIQSQAIIGEPRVSPVNPGAMPFDVAAEQGDFGQQSRMECNQYGCVAIPIDPAPRGSAVELRLIGLTADVRQFRPFRPVSGQWLDFTSAPSLAPGLVLNREAAKGLNRHRVPAEMRVNGAAVNATPRIIGVVDDGEGSPNAYIRADEMLNWVPTPSLANSGAGLLLMVAPDAEDTFRTLKARIAAAGGDPNMVQFEIIQSRAQVNTQLVILKWIFLGMATLVLLIGVAGILNVGLATVGERVEEFALRRAVGTPRSLLAAIVLAETLITGLLTAGVAIGVVALGLHSLGRYLEGRLPIPLDTSFPWQAAVAGIVAGLVAGLLGGLIPAIRAARIPIATVMRA